MKFLKRNVTEEPPTRIEDDFYTWLLDQASLLRSQRYDSLDWNNLAEELEAVARNEDRGLESQIQRLLVHLLKWAYQSDRRTDSWTATIENARDEIDEALKKSPGLERKFNELAQAAYRRARRTAGAQMRLSKLQWEEKLPRDCPWNLDQVLDEDFWPDPVNA